MAVERVPGQTPQEQPDLSTVRLPFRPDNLVILSSERTRQISASIVSPDESLGALTILRPSTRIITRPGTITPEEAQEYNEGKRGSSIASWIEKHPLLSRLFAIGVTVPATTTAFNVAYDNIPAVQQRVDSLRTDIAAYWNSIFDLKGDYSFNNEAQAGRITETNTLHLPIDKVNNLLEEQKNAGKASETTLLFPLVLPNDSSEISYGYQEIFKGFDPKTGKNIIAEDDRHWMKLPKVSGGTIVVAPIDAKVFTWGPKEKTGMVNAIDMKFTMNGIVYTLKIGSRTSLSEMIFKDLYNLPDQKVGRIQVERGTALLELQEGGSDLQISLDSTPVGSSKNEENPVNLDFLSTSNEAGFNKLVILSN